MAVLTTKQIQEKLSDLPGWEYKDGQIQKSFTLKDTETAEKLVNQIAMAAEVLDHHPNVEKRENQVTFSLSTHSASASPGRDGSENGVTEKDFALAKEIEEAAEILA